MLDVFLKISLRSSAPHSSKNTHIYWSIRSRWCGFLKSSFDWFILFRHSSSCACLELLTMKQTGWISYSTQLVISCFCLQRMRWFSLLPKTVCVIGSRWDLHVSVNMRLNAIRSQSDPKKNAPLMHPCAAFTYCDTHQLKFENIVRNGNLNHIHPQCPHQSILNIVVVWFCSELAL